MRGASAFEELLDEQLRNRGGDAGPVRGPARAGTATAYGFFLGAARESGSGWPVTVPGRQHHALASGESRFAGAVRAQWTGMRVPVPTADTQHASYHRRASAFRAPRSLSLAEQQALEQLVLLGARLDAEFTFDELRSAFRALALAYHPDRHSDSSDAERSHLASLFARAHEAYRVLAGYVACSRH